MAAVMKRHPLAWRSALAGRAVACVFEHSGLRSQVSLEVAVHRLGALPVVLQPRGESTVDTAHAVSPFCDAIAVRTDRHRDLLDLVEQASVPVINALTDREHPCRALADCLALRERFGGLAGLDIAYVGGREPRHALADRGGAAGGHDGADRVAGRAATRSGAARPGGQRGPSLRERGRGHGGRGRRLHHRGTAPGRRGGRSAARRAGRAARDRDGRMGGLIAGAG